MYGPLWGGAEGVLGMSYDLTLTEGPDGHGAQAHRPDCPVVQAHREQGKPLVTMVGCERPLPPGWNRHECLSEEVCRGSDSPHVFTTCDA
jgi:hypothetical protein